MAPTKSLEHRVGDNLYRITTVFNRNTRNWDALIILDGRLVKTIYQSETELGAVRFAKAWLEDA